MKVRSGGMVPALTALLAAVAVAFGCGGSSAQGTPSVAEILPPDGAVDSLRRSGPSEVFTGAGLYQQIDGGAELFLELGFDRLVVQDYEGEDAELEVELYVMRDDVAAAGAYLESCGRETPVPGLPGRNTVNAYQLQLVHGRYYLVVSDAAGSGDRRAALVELGRAVAERLPPAGPLKVFHRLPVEGRVPGSERVARGPLGLQRIVRLGKGDLLGLGGKYTAVAADYELPGVGRITRLVAGYPDAATAAAALGHLERSLDGSCEIVRRTPSRVVVRERGGRYDEFVVEGATVTARLRLPAPPAGS